MIKKICNYIFIAIVFVLLIVPFLFTDWSSGGVSVSENRNLAKFPDLIISGQLNEAFPAQFDIWFADHLGFRDKMLSFNASRQLEMYNKLMANTGAHIGPHGDLNYATNEMILDYAHANLLSEEELVEVGQSYQIISDWLAEKGIDFYYVQCYSKHSIYPEHFRDDIEQLGDISKTDQVIFYLQENTDVNVIYLKPTLLEAKENGYAVYGSWFDPTHWTQRGAFVGYQAMMERLNADYGNIFPVLQEEDYIITLYDGGETINDVIHEVDYVENFEIRDPKAQKLQDSFFEVDFDEPERHSAWVNSSVDNDVRLMLMCDSYIKHFIVEDFAESFSEVGLIWSDYFLEMGYAVDKYQPDIVLYETTEWVDRDYAIIGLAKKILAGEV